MSTAHDVKPWEPNREQRELVRLIEQILTLTAELEEFRGRAAPVPEARVKECKLEQLRRQLAAVARRTATDDLGAAA